MEFLRELGRHLQLESADHNSFTYLIPRLSVAVQRWNAASVLGSAGNMDSQEFFEALWLCFKLYVLYFSYYFSVLYCISFLF